MFERFQKEIMIRFPCKIKTERHTHYYTIQKSNKFLLNVAISNVLLQTNNFLNEKKIALLTFVVLHMVIFVILL